VLDESDEDKELRDAAEEWITAGKATRAAEFDGLLVVDLAR
jgi:hypothetical protein